MKGSIEKFLVLFSTVRQALANSTCEILEEAGIPVMLEHIDMFEDGKRRAGFRVLVPFQFSQTAMRLISGKTNAQSKELLPFGSYMGTSYSGTGLGKLEPRFS